MNRLTASVILSAIMGMAALGIALASPRPAIQEPSATVHAAVEAAQPARPPSEPDASALDLWVSESRDGEPVHSVLSRTNQVWAVLGFADAVNEDYKVQMRDLSGILVQAADLRASGTGRVSTPISVTQFVNTYKGILDATVRTPGDQCASEACTMTEEVDGAAANCAAAPPVPPMWPEPGRPTTAPGQPTPTPDPQDPYRVYRMWLDDTLGRTATSRQAMAEITRTNRALLGLPDAAADDIIHTSTDVSSAKVVHAFESLKQAERLLNPPDTLPNTTEGCRLIQEAQQDVVASNAEYRKMAPQMTDVDTWRFPPTVARWAGERFVACVQYRVELSTADGERRQDVVWSVGEPGPARLIFPSPGLVEASNLGEMNLTLPEGANAMYANSVTVPSANHKGTVTAYVTDAACIPVDGPQITFSILEHPEAGSLVPTDAVIRSGLASTELTAGQDAWNHVNVQGFVQTSGGPAPSGIRAVVPFNVVGPADAEHVTFLMRRDREINMAEDPTLNFSIQVRDEFGRAVADGSELTVTIPDLDPAALGYQKVPARPGAPREATPTPELVMLGKEFSMLTRGGMSQFPESPDPGFIDVGPLLVCTEQGKVTVSATIDGISANTNEVIDGHEEKTISCLSSYHLDLPVALKKGNVRVTQRPPQPIETATPRAPRR